MFQAILDITGTDKDLQATLLGSASKKLRKAGYTVDSIATFEKYWYAEDWRGRKGQKPTIPQVVAEISKSKGNGRATNVPSYIANKPADMEEADWVMLVNCRMNPGMYQEERKYLEEKGIKI